MDIHVSTLTIEAADLGEENHLPRFSDPVQDRYLTHDGTYFPEDEYLLGNQTGVKVLPYSMQDRYTRERSPRTVKTIILENDILKAVFLPDYRARLHSLTNKRTGQDILYCNQVLQYANLSQRNAWFSSGIEFNFGHSSLTCEPIFAARIKSGEEYSCASINTNDFSLG